MTEQDVLALGLAPDVQESEPPAAGSATSAFSTEAALQQQLMASRSALFVRTPHGKQGVAGLFQMRTSDASIRTSATSSFCIVTSFTLLLTERIEEICAERFWFEGRRQAAFSLPPDAISFVWSTSNDFLVDALVIELDEQFARHLMANGAVFLPITDPMLHEQVLCCAVLMYCKLRVLYERTS